MTPLLKVKERIVGPSGCVRMWCGSELELLPHGHLHAQAMTKYKPLPSVELLCKILDYDPETGRFTWLQSVGKRIRAGFLAGTPKEGYVVIQIQRKIYQAHRLAWLLGHGEDPVNQETDHVNRDRSDNRLCNLRLATHAQNIQNIGKPRDNTSGYKGVSWHGKAQKWRAYITANGMRHYLGYFETPEDGHAAYVAAAEKLHADFARTA